MSGMEHTVKDLRELSLLADEFAEQLRPADATATVIGLSGDLGSGKTAFTKALAAVLGIKDDILSPTFVLAKFYPLSGKPWKELVHIDAYRIEDEHELSALRFNEMVADPKKLIIIEWPEQLGKHYPSFASTLKFTFVDEHTRTIHIPA